VAVEGRRKPNEQQSDANECAASRQLRIVDLGGDRKAPQFYFCEKWVKKSKKRTIQEGIAAGHGE